jgi:outer membrane murein-binding lipoprotein Lpp
MNRIFLSITISIILSGCVSSKVEHLHTTTTELSANIEKFVELSNRTADLNRTLKLQDEQSFLSKQLSEKI